MATRPTGQGPGRRSRQRRHNSTHHDHEEDDHPAETRVADRANPPRSITWHLTDPAIEDAIARFVATAPPLPEDLRARLARMLRTNECHHDAAPDEPAA